MGKTGELKSIWQSASNTNVQFNLVSRGHQPWQYAFACEFPPARFRCVLQQALRTTN